MKKVLLLSLAFLLLMGSLPALAAPSTYRVLVNGHVVTGDTLSQNNTTLVPFRVIFQELSYQVAYEAKSQTIQAKKDNLTVSLSIGSKRAYVNGKEVTLPVAPKSQNGTTYVPLRFVASVSGESVALDDKRKAIQIGKAIDWAILDRPSFRNAKWGMTVSQVKKTEGATLMEDDVDKSGEHYLLYETKLAGFQAFPFYFFQEETLGTGGYFVKSSGPAKYVQDFRTLTAYLTKQYGEPDLNTLAYYKERGIEHTDAEWNQYALRDDEFGFVSNWRTADAKIMLVVMPGLQEMSDIQITFTSWRKF
ncbi:copper amine oxidase N-terminal domain-containing protein [Gorillibacterium sp. CAU 1737]|uniref:copper amine oxidase N-terminal domain-containing protein n=1 Tax=Gorillibacterium sp. CAU 1737 TaxID=3140362 RepID=UPI00326112BB